MKLNILFGFTAFILIFSGISSVVHVVFAEDCPGYPNCNNNQNSTNATVSINATSGTTIFNTTSSGNATVTSNGTSTNATSSGNETTTYNGTSGNYTSGTGNETNLVQPLIIVPSNMTNEINDTAAPVVPYDIGTIHSSVAAEVNIENQTVSTTSIDDNVSINATNSTPDTVQFNVSATAETGPKVILINLSNTTINVGNLQYLGITYDGNPVAPAANVDAILHAQSTDPPNFAIIVTQTGAQILISVPHFSTHTITLSNLEKVTSSTPIPEFPWAALALIVAIVPIIALSRKASFSFPKY